MPTTKLSRLLSELNACRDAREWADSYTSLTAAWAACPRADWMLWLAGRVVGDPHGPSRKRLVLCACACARTALKYVPKGELRPEAAIEMAERWARGDASVTLEDVVRCSREAAAAAANADAAAANATAAAVAAADAAVAATVYATVSAAVSAADAAVYATAAAAIRTKHLKQLANIVRRHYPTPPRRSR